MTVWIVWRTDAVNGASFVDVFDSKAGAEACADRLKPDRPTILKVQHFITEREVKK